MTLNLSSRGITGVFDYNDYMSNVFDGEIPSSVTILDLRNNQIVNITGIPNSVTKLYLSNNQITTITGIPDSVTELDLRNNQITMVDQIILDTCQVYGLHIKQYSKKEKKELTMKYDLSTILYKDVANIIYEYLKPILPVYIL